MISDEETPDNNYDMMENIFDEEESDNRCMMENMYDKYEETIIKFQENNLDSLNRLKEKGNTTQISIFKKKYKYLNRSNYVPIYETFRYLEFSDFNTLEFKHYIYKTLQIKIRGIYKHGQAAKTFISCAKIIEDSKKGCITIAITKNTLLANIQWTTRFISSMKSSGLTELQNEILVISSKINNLDGNATHCKDLNTAWSKICSNNNNFKVIFVCANKIRIDDICELLKKYKQPSFNKAMIKDIIIHYDEGHNDKSGIPTCREEIENMLLYKFVKEFVPITASHKPICDNTNPLWIDKNIKANKINYINPELEKTKIQSNDEGYSSIQHATHIDINKTYIERKTYNNTIPLELFKKHYPTKDYIKLGYINACKKEFCGDEELFLNSAKTILDNPTLRFKTKEDSNFNIFKKKELNIHIMITPNRTVITEMIMLYAINKRYKPLCIGLYGGKINYKYLDSNNEIKSDIIPNEGITREFNEILNDWLVSENLKNRCVIIFGNYQTVGESNTFVNSDYGYLRSTILPPGCNLNAEKHYQFLLRCCFLLERFDGLYKNDINKFIIGYKQGIDDAINYEKLNDEIVKELIDNQEETRYKFEYNDENDTNINTTTNIQQSIPVKCIIEDPYDERLVEMKRVMEKEKRTPEDKKNFMEYLKEAIINDSIVISDKNEPKINLENFTLTEFRCYKEDTDPVNYRFTGYYDNWELGNKYNNGKLNPMECGIYCCLKKHISTNGKHINRPNTFYLSFAY
jgi:hypothetical protein